MPDLKTFWKDPGGGDPYPELSGTSVASSGSDPQVTVDSPNALQPVWTDAPVPSFSGEETDNNVSGLPQQPNRFEPTPASPPEPPSLKDKNPGTIDER